MAKILVIEMTDRNINSVKEVGTIDEGVLHANDLLRTHMETINYLEEFEAEEDIECEWAPADAETLNAWCNYSNTNWDAHVYILSEGGSVVRVMEPDADGCGTDVEVFAQFNQKLDDDDLAAFTKTLIAVKEESIASGDPYNSLGVLLADAIEVFQCTPHARDRNLSAEVIAPVPTHDTDIEI